MADRHRIEAAINAWLDDGVTWDAMHPLDEGRRHELAIILDGNAGKDLARVIAHALDGKWPPHSGTVRGEVVVDSGELEP